MNNKNKPLEITTEFKDIFQRFRWENLSLPNVINELSNEILNLDRRYLENMPGVWHIKKQFLDEDLSIVCVVKYIQVKETITVCFDYHGGKLTDIRYWQAG